MEGARKAGSRQSEAEHTAPRTGKSKRKLEYASPFCSLLAALFDHCQHLLIPDKAMIFFFFSCSSLFRTAALCEGCVAESTVAFCRQSPLPSSVGPFLTTRQDSRIQCKLVFSVLCTTASARPHLSAWLNSSDSLQTSPPATLVFQSLSSLCAHAFDFKRIFMLHRLQS